MTQMETSVRASIRTAVQYSEDFMGARNYVQTDIKNMTRHNHVVPEYAYRILEVNHKCFEVWHHRPDGAAARIVAVVEEVK